MHWYKRNVMVRENIFTPIVRTNYHNTSQTLKPFCQLGSSPRVVVCMVSCFYRGKTELRSGVLDEDSSCSSALWLPCIVHMCVDSSISQIDTCTWKFPNENLHLEIPKWKLALGNSCWTKNEWGMNNFTNQDFLFWLKLKQTQRYIFVPSQI